VPKIGEEKKKLGSRFLGLGSPPRSRSWRGIASRFPMMVVALRFRARPPRPVGTKPEGQGPAGQGVHFP